MMNDDDAWSVTSKQILDGLRKGFRKPSKICSLVTLQSSCLSSPNSFKYVYPFEFQVIRELEKINDDDDWTLSSEQILAGFRKGRYRLDICQRILFF